PERAVFVNDLRPIISAWFREGYRSATLHSPAATRPSRCHLRLFPGPGKEIPRHPGLNQASVRACLPSQARSSERLPSERDNERAEPFPKPALLPRPVGQVIDRQEGVDQLWLYGAVRDVRLAPLPEVLKSGPAKPLPQGLRAHRPFVRTHPFG